MSQIFISKNKFTKLTMIDVAKISAKGQIVIPEDIRKKLFLKKGTKIILRQMGNKLILIPEKDFEKELNQRDQEEDNWNKLLEISLKKDWDNKEDEEEWVKYL